MSTLALIGLGSNLGDRKAILDEAVEALRRTKGMIVRAVSTYQETKPVGGPAGQGAFLNAAAALETTLDPQSLLLQLQDVETRLGRVRTSRWGERTLDLDLLLFGDDIIDTPGLTVPHLHMGLRRFVLAPLAEIAPEAVDPLTRRPVRELLANLDRRPSFVALARSASDPVLYAQLARRLEAVSFPRIELSGGSESWFPTWLQQFKALDLGGSRALKLNLALFDEFNRGVWAGRWILADDWVAESCDSWIKCLQESGLLDVVAQTMNDLLSGVRPTFLVTAGVEADENLVTWAQRNHGGDPAGWNVPILRLRTAGTEKDLEDQVRERMLEEILAVCAATRS
jgi:2-amino-4-hydroxy-6-hydroxymethyldihydropteridine diphosphokinase